MLNHGIFRRYNNFHCLPVFYKPYVLPPQRYFYATRPWAQTRNLIIQQSVASYHRPNALFHTMVEGCRKRRDHKPQFTPTRSLQRNQLWLLDVSVTNLSNQLPDVRQETTRLWQQIWRANLNLTRINCHVDRRLGDKPQINPSINKSRDPSKFF